MRGIVLGPGRRFADFCADEEATTDIGEGQLEDFIVKMRSSGEDKVFSVCAR